MKRILFPFIIIALFGSTGLYAQETFKVMFYNLLNYPIEDAVPNRENDLQIILSDYQPDLFLVCELNTETGANTILNIIRSANNPNFEMATYVSNTSDDLTGNQNDLQNLLYYDSTKFSLEDEIIVPTDLRDFNIYKLKLNTVNQSINPIELYVVVCHLKASSGPDNAQRRFEQVQELDNYLSSLPSDSHILLGGDLNLYTASESAFQELLDSSNHITLADPANRIGNWNNNVNFIDVFTQSTRTQSGLGGTTGGFDDRFDFILTSQNLITGSTISYVNDSYQVYGNNGISLCYNNRINSTNCSGPDFSFSIREALHNFSDHLPVTVLIETDEPLLSVETFEGANTLVLHKTIYKNRLSITFNSPDFFNTQLIVYNILGQPIKTFKTANSTEQTFDISGLANGLYFLVLPQLDIEPIKFIISH